MTDGPTNEQLANFLVVDAKNDPRTAGLDLQPWALIHLMETNPLFKAAALKKHAAFQEQINRVHEKMLQGKLQCAHIRPNGKHCVNWNEAGSYYCGLHKEDEDPN